MFCFKAGLTAIIESPEGWDTPGFFFRGSCITLVCLRGNALILSIDGPIAALRAARRSGFRLSGSFAWRFGAACCRLINAVHVARAQRPAVHAQRGQRFHRDGGGQQQLLLVLNTATCAPDFGDEAYDLARTAEA